MCQLVQDIRPGKMSKQMAFALCITLLKKVHQAYAEGYCKGSVSKKTGNNVGNQPITFQCRDQWLYAITYIRGK